MNVALDPALTGFGGAHGGYVMSLALRAMADAGAELSVWMRRTDDAPVDAYVATFLADSAAPRCTAR